MDIKKIFLKIQQNPIFLQSVKTMFLRILGVVMLFGFTLFLTHNYSPEIIGEYDFIRSFLLVTGSICILGTDQAILYFAGIINSSRTNASLRAIYRKMLVIITGMSSLSLLVLFIIGKDRIANFLNDEHIYVLILKATLTLIFYSVTLFNTETLRALERVYIAELFRNTFKYISVIIGSILLFIINMEEYLVDTFLIGFVFMALISTVMIFRILKKDGIEQKTFYSYNYIIKKSYPMAISTMAIFLLMSFDVMFLKKHNGNSVVAFYAVGVKLMSILLMIMNAVTITISTKIAESFYIGDIEELKKIMRNSARIIFLTTLPVVFLISLFSEHVLLFFGKEYLVAKESLIILIIGQCVCSFFGGVQVYLNMTGRQHIFQIILILAVIVNFTLNSFLVPEYGMIGAALSYSVSMFFWNLIAAIYIYMKDKVKVTVN